MDLHRNSKTCLGLLASALAVMLALMPTCTAHPEAPEVSLNPDEIFLSLRSLLDGLCEKAHQLLVSVVGARALETAAENANFYLDSIFDQEKVRTVLEFVQVAIRFLSEGAASGLNVIAAYLTDILRATGITVKLPFPHFTPEGVASVVQWALLALVGYWVLSLVLCLAKLLLRRVLHLLKLGVALWLFAVIVSDSGASSSTTAWRLAALVCGCALLGMGRSGAEGDRSVRVESQLRGLEKRLKEVERRRKDE